MVAINNQWHIITTQPTAGTKMNTQQLDVMKLRITPGYKLVMIAMIEHPDMNREQLSSFLNMDKTQLSTTTKKLSESGLISMVRNDITGHRSYKVLV